MAARNSVSSSNSNNNGSSSSSSSSSGGKFGIFKGGKVTTSGPQETTRLLLDSARVAHETEQIGWSSLLKVSPLVGANPFIFLLILPGIILNRRTNCSGTKESKRND